MRWVVGVCTVMLLVATLAPPASADHGPETYPPLPTEPLGGPMFVTQTYRDVLNREPDRAGLAYWAAALDAGTTPAELTASFVDTPEFAGRRAMVARLYLAALGRLPDPGGWDYWSTRAATEPPHSVAADLLISAEAETRLPDESRSGLIAALYANVLGRQPDPDGLEYWVGRADLDRPALLVEFAESVEHQQRTNAAIQAALLYTALLDRELDPHGHAYWTERLQAGVPLATVIDGFLRSDEYERRLQAAWCETVTLDDALTWQDDESRTRDPDIEHEIYANQAALAAAVWANEYPNALTTTIIDDHPGLHHVIGIHEPELPGACLPLLALLPHPEHVQFTPTPATQRQLEQAQHDILERVGNTGWFGIGSGRGRLTLDLSSLAIDVADGIVADFGPLIEQLNVGSFPYPMPDPPPDPRCWTEPADATDPADLGLSITVNAPSEIRAGVTASATFEITNNSTDTFTIFWGQDVLAYLGTGTTSATSFNGGRVDPLHIHTLEPGHTVTGPMSIATDACDPATGHRLPAGNYALWGHVRALSGTDDARAPLQTDHQIRLPAVPITITHE